MKSEIVVFISDGYADWELGFICAELNKPEKNFKISTIALTNNVITSMGGLKVIPDYSIESFLKQNQQHFEIKMLLLCGGFIWKELGYESAEIKKLIDLCQNNKVLISAICDATTFLAHNGYLNQIEHTGNSVEHIVKNCPHYTGNLYYIEKQCVRSNHLITANGTATLEFATEIMNYFEWMPKEEIDAWYRFNRFGFVQSN
jgi:putative intracellular protease/amidase